MLGDGEKDEAKEEADTNARPEEDTNVIRKPNQTLLGSLIKPYQEA